jgi:hypothetical protein
VYTYQTELRITIYRLFPMDEREFDRIRRTFSELKLIGLVGDGSLKSLVVSLGHRSWFHITDLPFTPQKPAGPGTLQ